MTKVWRIVAKAELLDNGFMLPHEARIVYVQWIREHQCYEIVYVEGESG
jgi:hypothetical protein